MLLGFPGKKTVKLMLGSSERLLNREQSGHKFEMCIMDNKDLRKLFSVQNEKSVLSEKNFIPVY